ncbi:MAG: MATE family efflux transporter [Clostridia bacterium]|nr:MATE family efflux transporter [Clostridia bacterium]
MTHGPLFKKIWAFTLPLMLSGILQLLFNAADMVVVGRAVGNTALAAVGCTGSMVNLIVNLFMGFSVGSSVVVAQLYGAKREKDVSEAVHTSMLISLIGGIFIGLLGFFLCHPLLLLMGTPSNVINHSVLYVRIYFCGMPAIGIFNFGSAVLRAIGETRKPMLYLLFAGIINVLLNLFFVLVFGLGVAGVSLATVLSQCVAAFLTVRYLIRFDGCIKFSFHNLRISRQRLLNIIRIGLPAGIQSSLFSISNMFLQSAINSFGSVVIAGNTAANNLEGFIYTSMNAFSQAAVTFTGQNVGANRWERVRRVYIACAISVTLTGLTMGLLLFAAGKPLLSLYNTNPDVIQAGSTRVLWISLPYFLCGLMETTVGMLRGMGKSVMPMIVSLMGACVFRIVWIYTLFTLWHQIWVVYASYPVSWLLTFLIQFTCFCAIYRRRIKSLVHDNNC